MPFRSGLLCHKNTCSCIQTSMRTTKTVCWLWILVKNNMGKYVFVHDLSRFCVQYAICFQQLICQIMGISCWLALLLFGLLLTVIPTWLLSEHLEPERVPFHCHSPHLTVLFVVHGSFTNCTDIILISIAKLSQKRWMFISGRARKNGSLISYSKIAPTECILSRDTVMVMSITWISRWIAWHFPW